MVVCDPEKICHGQHLRQTSTLSPLPIVCKVKEHPLKNIKTPSGQNLGLTDGHNRNITRPV